MLRRGGRGDAGTPARTTLAHAGWTESRVLRNRALPALLCLFLEVYGALYVDDSASCVRISPAFEAAAA